MKKIFLFILILSCSIVLTSCDKGVKKTESKDTSSTKSTGLNNKTDSKDFDKENDNLKFENAKYFNDLGKFMSARELSDESVFENHTKTAIYKNYKSNLDLGWKRVTETRLNKMEDWFEEEIKPHVNDTLNLFYPFSGPDVLHSFTFYPDANKYFFIALENTGSIPKFEDMSIQNIASYFTDLNQSIKDVVYISYFITRKMMSTMTKHKTDGVMPILCMFISKTGNDILDIKSSYFTPEGKFADTKNSNYDVPVVRFKFRKSDNSKIQTLYYFKLDLSEGAALKNSKVLDFIKSQGAFNTYAKAASYLMHLSTFKTIRDFITDNSSSVLEDDTAIPYKYFDKNKWETKFFGDYIVPISMFTERFQQDLKQAYIKQGASNLPFNMGYHVFNKKQNLMLFYKN